MATAENWEEVVRTNYTELLKYIATDAGLFGELKKAGIFTAIAMKTYTGLKNTTETIERMLSDLLKKDFESFKKFCEALNSSGQGNIVRDYLSTVRDFSRSEYTTTDGPLHTDSACYRGISFGVAECLKQHWNKLLVEINFDNGLLAQLESRNIVTRLQLTALKDKETEDKRADQMLCWLQNGTEKQFIDFCSALEANFQPHLVQECLTPKLTDPKISELNPPVIQENQSQSNDIHRAPEIRKDPEGIPGLIPLYAEVSVKDICFSPCSEEFLTNFKDKVLKKAAYKCDSKCRGRALIMNNKIFSQTKLGIRYGSDVDTENLEELFKRLKFDTVIHSNKTAADMKGILTRESLEEHHKDYDMFVLFLMSHGIQGEIYGMDGKTIKTEKIMDLFNGKNCPNLVGKPKLFFIQACQGVAVTEGVLTTDVGKVVSDSALPIEPQDAIMEEMMQHLSLEDDFNLSIPLEPLPEFQSDAVADVSVHEMADMAMIYATVQGFVSYRRTDTGSLFVNSLVKVLTAKAHETELMPMITETFSMVHDLEVKDKRRSVKQIGEKRDSLRREVYLLPQ